MNYNLFKKLRLFALILIAGVFAACNSNDSQAQLDADIALIEKYLADNNLSAEEVDLGLYVIKDYEGNGNRPNSNSQVLVNYRGYLPDGTEFDKNLNASTPFNLQGVVQGWQRGIPQFKEGGYGTLLMASYLGYGTTARPNIPANSVLIFDIELIAVF